MRVGLCDSGLGGIAILKEVRKRYPNNDYVYIGDNKNLPYGNKSKDELIQVEFQGHKNIIQIKDKQISIIEADCHDKTCVNMGILKSAFTPIVCLPNHLVIQYVNDDKEIDAMIN